MPNRLNDMALCLAARYVLNLRLKFQSRYGQEFIVFIYPIPLFLRNIGISSRWMDCLHGKADKL